MPAANPSAVPARNPQVQIATGLLLMISILLYLIDETRRWVVTEFGLESGTN
jgi:hypothetical protein